MGTVIQRNLQQGEQILVDTDSVLCFESSVGIDIQWVGKYVQNIYSIKYDNEIMPVNSHIQ
jgi:uncharacterized protein (AIM24 family)